MKVEKEDGPASVRYTYYKDPYADAVTGCVGMLHMRQLSITKVEVFAFAFPRYADHWFDSFALWLDGLAVVTPAPASSAAAVDQGTPAAQLTEDEKQWYDTLLACKRAYGNKEMTWQQIADRRGASGKTAKRKLQELQARQLPGVDDWPDREN